MADFRLTPRKIIRALRRIVKANLVAHIKGSPAIGKSAVTQLVADEEVLLMIDHRLSTSAPEDLTGLPGFKDGRAMFHPFSDLFPLEGDELPIMPGKFDENGDPVRYKGWLLFLDEIDSAPKSVQAAAYKLILDRCVGQFKLHPAVRIVTAGNLITDRAIVNSMGTAMQSRLIHLEMIPDFTEWYEDVALKQGYDDRIIGYLQYKPQSFYDFDPTHNNHSFCAPRTWSFMNKLSKNQEVNGEDLALFAGTLTPSVAAEFIAYCTMSAQLITHQQVSADPENAPVPSNPQVQYATVSHLMSHITDDRLSGFVTYVGRLSMSLQIMFFRGLIIRHPEMRAHAGYRAGAVALAKYLNGP